MNLSQRQQKQQQVPDLLLAGLGGLSLWSDPKLRANNSWQQLDNFDLVVDGSIRKILPPALISGPFTNVLYQLLEYRAAINNTGGFLRDVAIDNLGNLWDINGSTSVPYSTGLVATLAGGLADIPFLGQMQGYYAPFTIKTWKASTAFSQYDGVYRYSAADGNLYAYYVSTAGTSGTIEPKWAAVQGSTVADGTATWTNAGVLNSTRFRLNYGILVTKGFAPLKFTEWKYTPSNGAESPKVYTARIGVSAPLNPINVTSSLITPNVNGYSPATGRAYVWTYYNPNTLHDSSPSPFVGPTKITNLDRAGIQTELNGSVLQPLPTLIKGYSSYQSVYLEIPVSALTPTYGDGYTCIRWWATKDAGASFFLLTQLYDQAGNLISNGDGSIPVATLTALSVANSWTGFAPLPTPQNAVATVRVFDGGSTAINLAPDPENLGATSWTEATGTELSVVPNSSPAGQATFQYTGTGAAANNNIYRSGQINVVSGTAYTFQGFIDNFFGSGPAVKWDIINVATGSALSWVTGTGVQLDNTRGTVTGTFTGPGSGKVEIRAVINGATVLTGDLVLWGDPYLETTAGFTTSISYPTPDSSLVYPAPAAQSQQPPPAACLTGTIFENTLFLVDYNNPTQLWYCNPGDFNSYGINAYLQFPTDKTPAIMELIPAFDRLLVSGGRTIDQVLSNSPSAGFARLPFDPQHGSLSYRGSIPYGSGVLALMDPGIAHLKLTATLKQSGIETGFTPEAIISRPIKPLLDLIDPATIHLDADAPGEPIPVIDNKQDLYLLGYRPANASTYMDTVVAMPLRGAGLGQFSRLTPLPGNGQVVNFREVQLVSTRAYGVLALTGDKKVYQMFAGTQDGTLTATAVTQPLPTVSDVENPALWDTEKLARELVLEGQDLPNFTIYASTDGGSTFPYGPFTLVSGQNLIELGGIQGRQFTFKIVHSVATTNVPQISALKLSWDVLGKQP